MHENRNDRIAREALEADQRRQRHQEDWNRQVWEQEARERQARENNRVQRSGRPIAQVQPTDIPTPLAIILLLVIGFLLFAWRHQPSKPVVKRKAPVPHATRHHHRKAFRSVRPR